MSSPEAGFLAEIIDHPDDDTPRRILADWYEENGQPERAEFIRLQLDQASLPEDSPRRHAIEKQATTLLDKHDKDWLGPLARVRGVAMDWRRGMVEAVTLSLTAFVRESKKLFRLAPIRDLTLRDYENRLDEFVTRPELARLKRLALQNSPVPTGDLQSLLASDLGALRQLAFVDCELALPAVRALAASGRLAQLTHLDLGNNRVTPTGLRALFESGHLTQLEVLELSHNALGNTGAQALGQANLPSLRQLDLSYCELHAAAGRALAESSSIRRLEKLNLHFNELHAGGATSLAGAALLDTVWELNVGFNEIRDGGVAALAESPHTGRVRSVKFSHSYLGNNGARRLARSPMLGRLHTLYLNFNHLTDEGLEHLAQSPSLAGLVELSVSNNEIGTAGWEALASSPYTTSLEDLSMHNNPMGTDGALALAASPHLGKLRRLDVIATDSTDEGIKALRRRFGEKLETS